MGQAVKVSQVQREGGACLALGGEGGSGKSLELKQTEGSGERRQGRGQWSLLKLGLVHMFIIPAFGR